MPADNEFGHLQMPGVSVAKEWILGPDDTPFYTNRWYPTDEEPKAYILFMHGYAEHIQRYAHFFPRLAAPPCSLHITAFDQRGHGRTAYAPLTADSVEVQGWKQEGKTVKLEKNTKRRTGGWPRVMPDVEWFVRREKERAGSKALFLWGFSMGGGQALGFATRPVAPPSKDTLGMLAGIIAGGPEIRLTHPQPWLKVKAGSIASNLLPNFIIPSELKYEHLSHNTESNERTKKDPFCVQEGSMKGLADMLNFGIALDSSIAWNSWPENLPLLLYHGTEDQICDPKATQRFAENVKAKDVTLKLIDGMYHEIHNELDTTPIENAQMVCEWIHTRIAAPPSNTATASDPVTSARL